MAMPTEIMRNPRDKLLPFGWGLLYGYSSTEWNMTVTYTYEPPPSLSFVDGNDSAKALEPCHWLNFTASRTIEVGENLIVKPPLPETEFGSVFDASGKVFIKFPFQLPKKFGESGRHRYKAPSALGLLEDSQAPAVLGGSQIHGLGVFANHDIAKGQVVEVVPSLPIRLSELAYTTLEDYIFQSTLTSRRHSIVVLHLGFGSIYNHSGVNANIAHYKFRTTPYLDLWIAQRDIAKGEELCHDYGCMYFKTRALQDRSCQEIGVQFEGKPPEDCKVHPYEVRPGLVQDVGVGINLSKTLSGKRR